MQIPKPNHKRGKPKRSDRGKFPPSVRAQILERDQGICQQCFKDGEEIHHIIFKSRGGRGVFANGVTLCQSCHGKAHSSAAMTEYWITIFTDRYGSDFHKDEWDE